MLCAGGKNATRVLGGVTRKPMRAAQLLPTSYGLGRRACECELNTG